LRAAVRARGRRAAAALRVHAIEIARLGARETALLVAALLPTLVERLMRLRAALLVAGAAGGPAVAAVTGSAVPVAGATRRRLTCLTARLVRGDRVRSARGLVAAVGAALV